MRFPALRARDLRIYIFGNFFALNGLWIQRVVVGWLGWDLTGQASWVGLIAFLMFAPTMISGPLFGVVADRVDIRRAALVTQSLLALTAVALLALFLTGFLTIWTLAATAVATGVITSAHHPIRMAMLPRLVPREALANAVALVSINFNFARLMGPAVGGLLISGFGVSWALLVNVVCFLPLLGALGFVQLRPRDASAQKGGTFFGQLAAGARYVAGQTVILHAMILNGLFSFIVRGTLEILPAIADGVYQRGAEGLGQILAAAGAGALASSVLMAYRHTAGAGELPPVSTIAAFAGFALVALLGLVGYWPLALISVCGMGFTGAMVGIGYQSTVQLSLEDGFRGRVMSLWTVVGIGGAALGAIGLGALVDVLGLQATLTSAASAGIAMAAFLILRTREDAGRALP